MPGKFLEPVDSVDIYKPFWLCWRLVGIGATTTGCTKYLLAVYDLLLNGLITVFYPLHLTIGLFMEPTQADIFKNLAINVTCIVCSLKHYLFRYKLQQIRAVEAILAQLDKRAVDPDERQYFNRGPKVGAQRVVNLFFGAYIGANVTAAQYWQNLTLCAALAVLLGSERRLMYPAWFPFDWQANAGVYWLAFIYQLVGVSIQIVQNLANDTYPAMTLCIIGGHVRLLSMRVAKIGHRRARLQRGAECSSSAESEGELVRCIEDHKQIIIAFNLLQDTLSLAQLAQFISSGLNICIVLVYLLFYVDNAFLFVYYTVYFIAMGIEIFPCCYYGSLLQREFDELPYALFSSNWLEQLRVYRQHLIIFMQLTLRSMKPLAGGIIEINLNAFFATCKMAYSLFAVIQSVK